MTHKTKLNHFFKVKALFPRNCCHVNRKGAIMWYKDENLHRDDDKPAVVLSDGGLAWFKNDKLHREKGPALIYLNGNVEYWKNGIRQHPSE